MKREHAKKRSKIPAKETPPESAVPREMPAEVKNLAPTSANSMPPPDLLFREAEQEPDFRSLSHYVDCIRVLRKKGFSYREIADWLSERGVPVDHNAVYRVYHN